VLTRLRAARDAVTIPRGLIGRLGLLFAVLPWLVILVGTPLATLHVGPEGTVPAGILVPSMTLIFGSLIGRSVLLALRAPQRRFPAASFVLALVLWAAGSAQVNAAPLASTLTTFPAPGEWLFFANAAALAVYLFLEGGGRVRPTPTDWLEAAVASGGAVCLVALLVVTPVAEDFARQGVPLLVALIYPVLDVVLLAVVVAQITLRRRAPSVGAGLLVAGLLMLTGADASGTVVYLDRGTYAFGWIADLAWVVAYILLTESVARPWVEPRPRSEGSASGARVTVAAATVALGVVVFQPPGAARPYVVVPAVVTILAVGARLVLALRQAREAAEAYRLSRTDDLTGLPNRRAVVTDLATLLAAGGPLAVALVDLDGFKEVNDSLGHASGDALLQVIARRLRHSLPDDVVAARLASDEFALVLRQSDIGLITDLAEDVRRLVRRPIHLDGLEVSVEASIGVAVRTPDIATKGDLLRCADVALIQAKASHAGVVAYDPDQDEFSRSRLALAEDLRRGLKRGQLVVWYQPQVDAQDGSVRSVEALVRWKHPSQGLLAPFAFLPAARRAGLMAQLTEVVLATAVRDLAAWSGLGLDVNVAVNVAPPELLGGTLLPELGTILAREGVPANRLIIEVTEDSFLAEPEHARRVIQQLRDQDIQVSIDDYGTGFSSLAYLRDLPLQELKIDRSFIANILTDTRSWMIVNTTNQLAHGLGLRTVAEGVEDEQLRDELQAIGVDVLQGFLFARPMPPDHLVDWLKNHRRQTVATSA
jgi:diguanylate cyclase (GGDEF)-like protein